MAEPDINIVTGASGFSGKYIARRLLANGVKVISLTGHPDRKPEFGESVTSVAYNFDRPSELAASMRGASVLYNTYWIRFAHGELTFEQAIENTKTLINAARQSGVGRIVHVSIANPSEDSPLPYYRGKALVEKAIIESGLSYAILRPAVLFGDEGILINNIAYFLRHFPAFGIPGSGKYRMRPIYVEDLADLAVSQGRKTENVIIDAVGPESFLFDDLLKLIARTVGSQTIIMHLPVGLALLATNALGKVFGDVVLTTDEVAGLTAGILNSHAPTAGPTKLSDWLEQHRDNLGTSYFSEMKRHF